MNMTKPIVKEDPAEGVGERKVAKEIDYDSMDTISATDVTVPMPPSHIWRYAAPAPGVSGVVMTIAKSTDKKQERAETASEYYRKHGNPNRGGKYLT